jgi:hypothetical protein
MAARTGKPDGARQTAARPAAIKEPTVEPQSGVRPWHLLLVGVLALAAASLVVTSGTGVVNMVTVAVTVLTAGLMAAAVFRSLLPLTSPDAGERTEMLGGRTRAALEREKMLVLRSIKEIEFDHAMRKISHADYQDMQTRLRARAAGLLRQLDGGGGYRELIERDLSTMTGRPAAPALQTTEEAPAASHGQCPACATANDPDARFCKACGAGLERRS